MTSYLSAGDMFELWLFRIRFIRWFSPILARDTRPFENWAISRYENGKFLNSIIIRFFSTGPLSIVQKPEMTI